MSNFEPESGGDVLKEEKSHLADMLEAIDRIDGFAAIANALRTSQRVNEALGDVLGSIVGTDHADVLEAMRKVLRYSPDQLDRASADMGMRDLFIRLMTSKLESPSEGGEH